MPLDNIDREELWVLGQWAKQRDALCVRYGMVVAPDTAPLDAAAFLRSRLSHVPRMLHALLSPLASYPFHPWDQLAKRFSDVQKPDLNRTVTELLEC